MNVCVLGGTGMLGRHLKEIAPDWTYIGRDFGNLTNDHNRIELSRYLIFHKYDYVVNLAALVGGIEDNQRRKYNYLLENTLINSNVLEAIRLAKIPGYLAILSTCIYPDNLPDEVYPLKEEMIHAGKPHETNLGYAYSKRWTAVAIDCCNAQFGTKYTYVMPSNLYSEYDRRGYTAHYCSQMFDKVLDAVRTKNDIIEFSGDAYARRQYLYAGDLAKIVKWHVENQITECYNVAPERELSCLDMVNISLDIMNAKHIKPVFSNTMVAGQTKRTISVAKLKSLKPDFDTISFAGGAIKVLEKWQ
jgi:GDP-L-fucose synthase